MKIKVAYEGFNLRGGFEYTKHSEKAEQLFKDYDFDHKVIDISGEKKLSWEEYSSEIEIPFLDIFRSEETITDFIEKYGCQFILNEREGIQLYIP